MRRARRLFARVLDAPGGLAIETIHGFCQSLLRRFPVEAGVPPHFQVMEERDAAELMTAAREEMLTHARSGVDARLTKALATLTAVANEDTFGELMRALAGERGRLARLIDTFGSLTGAATELRLRLGLAADENEASLVASACGDRAFDAAGLRSLLPAMMEAGKTDMQRAAAMATFLAADADERPPLFDDWCGAFLTKAGEPFAKPCTKEVEAAAPGAGAILVAEAERLVAVNDQRRAARTAVATEALLALAGAQLDLYRRHKTERALLDYDDLIQRAVRLLDESAPAWVHYKLDQGIDHVLIDEAQDTNPEQWTVVERLTQEFFAGRGTREEGRRTVFAVGDVKQSIFGFQRADPAEFPAMRARFAKAVPEAGGRWEEIALSTSFRSTPAVLRAVDLVFAQAEASDGVAEPGERITHAAWRAGSAGHVELWPAVEPRAVEEPLAWQPPTRRTSGDDPQVRLASLLARRIRAMIDGERLEASGRPIRAGDVLVLVRQRTYFVEALVRALKALNVPVAGTDRMVLTEQLAVMDLIALGKVLLLPEDDLTLATVLKGPLIGLSEDELFTLAWNRPAGRSLWDALRTRMDEPVFGPARTALTELLGMADRLPPHELFARILTRGGKAKLLARLGVEAEDAINEFMALTLAHERLHPPSLQGFLAWVERGAEEIKRDLDAAAGAVRIMTVHGAKGLEAPVVILADTTRVPRHHGPQFFWTGERGAEIPLWAPRSEDLDPVGRAAKADADRAREQEYRRLLYVAMTRAADRLIVCGWKTKREAGAGCWYNLIASGLEGAGGTEPVEDEFLAAAGETAGNTVTRLATPQTKPVAPQPPRTVPTKSGPLPAAWRLPPEAEPNPPRPLAPSRPAGAEPPVRSPFGVDDGWRYRRGRIIHRLLELLPDLAPARRPVAMKRFLDRARWGLDEEGQAEIARVVTGVLVNPDFAPLWAPRSRAEVPVVGMVGRYAVSGQIDRLAEVGDDVHVVDYKSDRPPPVDAKHVPRVYLGQMAAYRALLTAVYPGKRIVCALLWTDGPTLMRLADAQLEEALSLILRP